jgi:hypothetical protein
MPQKTTRKKTAKKPAGKKNVVLEHSLFETHPNHGSHLCELVAKRQMAKVAVASKGARFLCHICGRAANKKTALCEPIEI